MQPTAGPTTRRGGLTAGSGENDAGNKDAGKNDAGNNDAGKNDAGKNDAGNNDAGKNDAGNNDALPTDAGKNDHHLDSTQAAVLLSTVRAASEEEKSPFEASMLQQYQKAMMMQIHAQMAMGGLLPNPLLGLANPLLSSALKMPSGTSNAFYPSREPTPARRQLSGPVKGAVRKASQQARGRRAYSTSVLDRDVLDEFIPGTADEEELKKRRRKESNRESARRSRLRKQAECDSLQGEIAVLRNEVGLLRKENTELRNLVTTLRGTEEKGEPRV